ncbi:MAG: nicotinate-nucleotide--dimethylbenzimidazole phosphoribosyltransferase [Elusimicrobia bacterium]|nr:nicotinate-nucleotide--dimethylbenzimidazole phosphoribosyltransferase [Elusimicrobiota bacterium]
MKLLQSILGNNLPADTAPRPLAHARLEQLTMPHWALGRLMDLAEDLAAMTGQVPPPVARKTIVTFAADHGVAAEGVSQYPAEVTPQMVRNFVRGGAAVNALAKVAGARVQVVDMGVAADLNDLDGKIISRRAGNGSGNIARGPAMTREQAVFCLEAGIQIAQDLSSETDVFGTGDMGIGNTTPSAAIMAVFTGRSPAEVTGRGTGVDDDRLSQKIRVVEKTLDVNRPNAADGVDVLAKVGGFDIGAIAGLILGAAALKKPVIIDGFISGAGALIAQALCPAALDCAVAAHRSAERGHFLMLERLGKKPLLDLNLRLGEGTGAALAMPLLDAAVRLLTDVATFGDAGVSRAEDDSRAPA